ncbi:MAG: HAL/PAL/TAL family ammonia-lyase [Candidatus Cyclobacteriaceae bacterium M2_1C_046]
MVEIGFASLTLENIKKVISGEKVRVTEDTKKRVEESYSFLKEFSKDKIIYGINTGFGPMAQYKVDEEEQKVLQYNLIRSHASGLGNPLPAEHVKASMLARLNTLSLGYSGINNSAIEVLEALINHDVTPMIYEHGGVGASGDLVQLAHLALVMIGEGKVEYKGEIRPTKEIYNELGIKPMEVTLREGLAVMNGTSVMTGIGLINSVYAKRAIEWSLIASSMICEIVDAYDDYFSPELNESKKHIGQQEVAKIISKHLSTSKYIRKREPQPTAEEQEGQNIFKDKVQEYYSIRCVPQIVGAILETVEQCQKLLVEEANSANDNPIVDLKSRNVLHGGNFHGDYVAFEMDKLKIAVTKLSMLAERQLNFLMNPKLNNILTPFVNLGKLGVNFGMQGVQFTAVSSTAENQTLSNPMYVHSIPNNNDNQDIVSMGANAALITKQVINNTYEVLAIEIISIVQALDLLEKTDGLSDDAKETYSSIRNIIPKFVSDFPIYEKLREVKTYMMENSPVKSDN